MPIDISSVVLGTLTSPAEGMNIRSVVIGVLTGVQPEGVTAEIDLAQELHVIEDRAPRALTGVFEEQGTISGWLWDRRRMEDQRWSHGQYGATLGGHSVGLKDGTRKAWWQSGTILDCEYVDTVDKFMEDQRLWTPRVGIGEYALQFDNRLLYSDYSYTGVFNTAYLEDDALMKHVLPDDAVWTSIQISLWKRDSVFSIRKHWDFKFVEEFFTGEFGEDSRLPTVAEGGPIYENISTRKKEFLITDDNEIHLNGIHYVDRTFHYDDDYPTEPPKISIDELLEYGGTGQDDGRSILTEFLPLQVGSTRVWVLEDDDLTEWTAVDDLGFAEPDEQVFQVDEDLGIITMGGFQGEDLVLQVDLTEEDTEIPIYPEQTSMQDYPESGVIVIGSEEIAYLERTNRRFSNCIRGYNSTTAAVHSAGDTIEHRRMGLGTTGEIYLEYVAVPRVDCEVTPWGIRTANTTRSWLNIQPVNNVETGNILQIHPGDISLDAVTLETDSPLIGGNQYGPVFYGSDVSRMTATGYDPHGNPLPDVDLTISILSGTGFLNGVLGEFTDIANTLGEIYAYYVHPLNQQDLEFEVASIVHSSGDTIMVVPELTTGTVAEDIWVFQILKFDKIIGTVGLPLEITDVDTAVDPYGAQYLDLDGVISQDFRDGVLRITISSVDYYRTITWLENLLDVDDVLFTRLYVDEVIPGVAAGQTAYLLEPDAIEWDPDLLNGTRYILYEFSEDAEHPVTHLPGAYTPVHPDVVNTATGEITFTDRELPLPDPDDNSEDIGGYVVIAPGQVILQASGVDPITAQTVESGEIKLILELPSFMVGVDSSGTLPLPVGWNFQMLESNVGTGIGEPNFITLNPRADLASMCLRLEIS